MLNNEEQESHSKSIENTKRDRRIKQNQFQPLYYRNLNILQQTLPLLLANPHRPPHPFFVLFPPLSNDSRTQFPLASVPTLHCTSKTLFLGFPELATWRSTPERVPGAAAVLRGSASRTTRRKRRKRRKNIFGRS